MAMTVEKCIAHAERKRAGAEPNEDEYVARWMRDRVAENTRYLDMMAGCSLVDDVVADLERQNTQLTAALSAYAASQE